MTTRTPGPIECDRQVIVGDHSLNGVLSWLTRVNSNAWTISSIALKSGCLSHKGTLALFETAWMLWLLHS